MVKKVFTVKATLVVWATHDRIGSGKPQRFVFTFLGEDVDEARNKALSKVTQMKAYGCHIMRRTTTLVQL